MHNFLYYINECSFATPLNTPGMGDIIMPTDNTTGTIDAAACCVKQKTHKRRKLKSIKKYIEDNLCHQNMTDTMK